MSARKNSGFWAYAEKVGRVGASGDDLAQLKKAYRREYEKEYKRKHRAKHKQFIVSFNQSDAKRLRLASLTHDMKEAEFIKKAVWGYVDSVFVVRHKEEVDRILQLLLRYQTAIEKASESNQGSWFKPDRNYKDLERAVIEISKEVNSVLKSPPRLVDLVRQALDDSPNFNQILLNLLMDHGISFNEP